jgi:hypothetical protein
MSNLTQSELTKVRKLAFYEDLLTSDTKDSVINAQLRSLNAEIKKSLSKKDTTIEIFVVRRT